MSINKAVGMLTMRLLLGFIFLMQGYGKVFNMGVENLLGAEFFAGTFNPLLPDWLVTATAYYTSYIELIGGAMLVLGFRRNIALYLLASVLVIVTFGHGLAEPIWDLQHVMYRALLLIPLLLLPQEWDRFSVDGLLGRGARKAPDS